MKQVEINLKAAAFPDEFASDAQKDTAEYGLQVGQAIQYEWFRKELVISTKKVLFEGLEILGIEAPETM